jgi:hypothetical protein
MCRGSYRSGRGHRLVTGAGLWLGLVLGLALPADAQVSQFTGFPGEYAANWPLSMGLNRLYSPGLAPYSYSPAYSQPAGGGWTPVSAPGVSPPGWGSRPAPLYYGAGSLPGLPSSRRLNGTGYDAGLFSSRRLNGTGYDAGLFSSRPPNGTGYDSGLFSGRR